MNTVLKAANPAPSVMGASHGDAGKDRRSSTLVTNEGTLAASSVALPAWAKLYADRPSTALQLYEMESMVATRMELLAWIDRILNSQATQSFDEVLRKIVDRLGVVKPHASTSSVGGGSATLSNSAVEGDLFSDNSSSSPSKPKGSSASSSYRSAANALPLIQWTEEEDVISHLICRFAFSMNEKWRLWFLRVEEILFRARMTRFASDPRWLRVMLSKNGLPCEPLTEADNKDKLRRFAISNLPYGVTQLSPNYWQDMWSVPIGLATRLVKTRQALCVGGRAILRTAQVTEVLLTAFKGSLAKGLQDAFRLRSAWGEEHSQSTVMAMADAFLTRFVADPQDQLREMQEGVVRAADIPTLSQTHFPLCMRRIDSHLRTEGHIRHHGRFSYGLFLKAIGLSLEDSMLLFSQLMTLKGGNSPEAFAKSAYGYNVRHNYGKEGKKTSYSSLSCVATIALPPNVDRHDCHGCPFRFRDEGAFRSLLQKEQPNPYGSDRPTLRPTAGDIEEIVKDAKEQHYTRACYKYFMSTHPDAKRDQLFRSPFEYFVVSMEVSKEHQAEREKAVGRGGSGSRGGEGGATPPPGRPAKRTMMEWGSPSLKEGVTKARTEGGTPAAPDAE